MEKIGFFLTMIWLTLIAFLIYLKFDDAFKLSLNEWGDFLAGTTAPIAFLWLIIGYFLQRKELNMNTKALLEQRDQLLIQAEEAKKQTESLKTTAQQAIMRNIRGK